MVCLGRPAAVDTLPLSLEGSPTSSHHDRFFPNLLDEETDGPPNPIALENWRSCFNISQTFGFQSIHMLNGKFSRPGSSTAQQ